MQEDEKTRALPLPERMERRKRIEEEHKFRRGAYDANEIKHPRAALDTKSEAQHRPWKDRDKNQHLYKH